MTHDALRSALEARLGEQYEIESLLGQGGMGSVFRAMDRTLHRPVAIKVISGDLALNPQLKDRFLMEARTVAKLRHPNIVAVYSAGEADGLLYFVMELVPGESLRDLLTREGRVDPARAERILHELALALDYAHANGIVHRDVKPENILLDRDTGRAMLTDFGVARALENSGNMTGTGMILGSPRYMSPEQATGESTLDGRSDLYALALVGYEMFTGKPVVESGNVAGMLVKHLTETPKPLAEAATSVPEGAAVAIDRALAKDREQRWATGREMAEVIAAAWTPSPGSGATRALAGAKAAAKPRRRRALAAAGATAVTVAVAALAFAFSGGGGDPRKSYAVVPFDIQSGNADVQWLRDGAVNMLTLALSQWTDLQVMDYERTLKFVADAGVESRRVDLERAQEIARRGGAGTLVMGQVSTTQDSLIVVARLYDVKSGRALNTATRAAGIATDPRGLFDDIARYLLDVAGGESSASVDVARQTTTSLTAYRAYLDGVRYLNSWRLAQADSALQVAIDADSTFALAWHKRALALGWGDFSDPDYLRSARRAAELADRLPPRQQALVRGHRALSEGIADPDIVPARRREHLREAQRIYADLVATDSLVAEGWYGLADAYFHDNGAPGDSIAQFSRRLNGAIRGFRRAIAIDSSFHLAYSHLVQQYAMLAGPQAQAVLDGDSVLILTNRAQLDAMGGLAEFERRRARARDIGLEMARGWVRADPDAPTAHLALATSFFAAERPDSALAVINRAMARPGFDTPSMRLQRATFRLLSNDLGAFDEMREILRTVSVAAMREVSPNERITGAAMALNSAGAVGNAGEVDRMVSYFSSVDSVFPFTTTPTREVLAWYATAIKGGITGTLDARARAYLAEGARRVSSGTMEGIAGQIAATSGGAIYLGYLVTRDTLYAAAIRRLPGGGGIVHSDLDALEALARGDTAAARAIASGFTPPDSLPFARFSFAGLRAYGRAEVLAAVGNVDWAIAYLEALDPLRFNASGIGEPGFAVYTRSFLTRASLYERRNEPDKAITAYEEYLRRTTNGDAAVEPLRRAARESIARLRDRGR